MVGYDLPSTSGSASRSKPPVVMVKTVNPWHRRDPSDREWLHFARRGRVLVQRQVRPAGVIVADVLADDSFQMSLAEDDHVVKTFTPNRTDKPFDERLLPG